MSHINPKRPHSRWVSPGGVKLTQKSKLGEPKTVREGGARVSRVLPESHLISCPQRGVRKYPMVEMSHINPKRPPSRWVSPGGVRLTRKSKLGIPKTIREGGARVSRVLPESHVISCQGGGTTSRSEPCLVMSYVNPRRPPYRWVNAARVPLITQCMVRGGWWVKFSCSHNG